MTANTLISLIQQKTQMFSTGDIPVKYNEKDLDVRVEVSENEEGYYINIVDNG